MGLVDGFEDYLSKLEDMTIFINKVSMLLFYTHWSDAHIPPVTKGYVIHQEHQRIPNQGTTARIHNATKSRPEQLPHSQGNQYRRQGDSMGMA